MFPTLTGIQSLRNALDNDLLMFLPELVVCAGVVLLLLVRLVPALDKLHLGRAAAAVLVCALFAAHAQVREGQWAGQYFGAMLTSDTWGGFVRVVVPSA